MKRIFTIVVFAAIANLLNANDARIIDFHSDIKIENDGRIDVKETICIYADGYDIKRGIVRTLPDYRTDAKGKKVKMKLSVVSVTRDRRPENFRTEKAGEFTDVYIGDSDHMLEPGEYEYEVSYYGYGHIGFFDEYDELYWNVTGNDWAFDIEEASASVRLPEGSKFINTACYTGFSGSSKSDCLVEGTENRVVFRTRNELQPREGLTIAVSFPRDIINRPPPPSKAEMFWEAYKQEICYGGSFLLILLFYVISWLKVGIDPKQPVIIPTFKPPYNWSPAVVRYLYKRGYDNKVFTTVLVSLAVKGIIRIRQKSKLYFLGVLDEEKPFSDEEKVVFNRLFSTSNTIRVSNTSYSTFSATVTLLRSSLKKVMSLKDYFLKNISYIVLGAFFSLFLIIISLVIAGNAESVIVFLFTLPFVFTGIFAIIAAIKRGGCSGIYSLLMGLAFAGIAIYTQFTFLQMYSLLTSIFILVMFVAFGIYVYLIKAPTELGAKTRAELEGFRMYLKTAEENRLNLLTPPDRTPELFEALLPYAIALDVENEWGKKFDDILKQTNYEPTWYHGSQPFRPVMFANNFSNSFNSSVQRAQVNPESSSSGSSGSGGWSSGSSGGGFSGGGGGGGGGRGW